MNHKQTITTQYPETRTYEPCFTFKHVLLEANIQVSLDNKFHRNKHNICI